MTSNTNMIDKSYPIPAYHQIVSDMLERINRNEWKLGERLPSESVLAGEYNVSRVTIRQSLAELQHRGIVTKYQGKGTYLAGNPKPFLEDLNLPSIHRTRDPKEKNVNNVLELRLDEDPPQYVREIFTEDSSKEPLVYVCRTFSKKGHIIGLSYAWFPVRYVPGLVNEGLMNTSISQTLRDRYHYQITRVDNVLDAIKANAQVASLLSVPYDAALLRIQSSHYTKDGAMVQFSNTLWVGELTRFLFSAQ